MSAPVLAPPVLSYRHRLEEALAGEPTAPLFSDERCSISRAELRDRVERTRAELAGHGVGPEQLVATRFEPGVDALVAILSVLATGAAYLPLDPRHGAQRADQILQTTTPNYLYDTAGLQALEHPTATQPVVVETLDQLAYVISTSGSTGQPKAAMLEQRGFAIHTQAMIDLLELDATDVVLQTAPPSFDIAVWQCTTPVIAGARTHVASAEERLDPRALWRVIIDQRVTVTQLVPSMIRVLLDKAPPRESLALRHVISTGEALDAELARRWFDTYPDLPLINMYGPAECTDDVCVHVLRATDELESPLPIGSPFAGAVLRVVSEQGTPVADGEVGELQVCGDIVGRGYRNDPERTAASFGTVSTSDGTMRSYDTGDLVYKDGAGLFRYVGRRDFQVKIRGNRVELGEIEARIAADDRVRMCVVVKMNDNTDRLAAHVETEANLDRLELRAALGQALPQYMVPSAYIMHRRLPVSANGKIDLSALPDPTPGDLAVAAVAGRPPETPTEQALASNWADLLDLEQVPVDADFFDLGGTSLLAVLSIDELSRTLGYEIPTATLITGGTIERIAAALDERDVDLADPHQTRLVQLQAGIQGAPLFLHPGEAATALGMVELGRRLQPGRSVYVFEPSRPVEGEPPPPMSVLAERCRAAIATVQPSGPVHVGGFCMGGDVAWEIAHQREQDNEPMGAVLLLQTERDGVYPSWGPDAGRSKVLISKLRQRLQFEIATARALDRVQRRSHIRHLVIGKLAAKVTLALETRAHDLGLAQRFKLRPSVRLRQHLWARVDKRAYDGWTPAALHTPVTVVAATEQPPMIQHDPLLGWGSTGSRHLSPKTVRGFHWTILHQPSVLELSTVVSGVLDQADEEHQDVQ